MHNSKKFISLTLFFGLVLTGCTATEENIAKELKSATSSIKGKVEALPEFIPYTPTDYLVSDLDDPFGPAKAQLAGKNERLASAQPDMKRIRQPLESFPLEALEFGGTIIKSGVVNALISNQDSLYTVKLGNYIGQNHGKVIKISENEILLMEEVQEPSGDWITRENRITLPQ